MHNHQFCQSPGHFGCGRGGGGHSFELPCNVTNEHKGLQISTIVISHEKMIAESVGFFTHSED